MAAEHAINVVCHVMWNTMQYCTVVSILHCLLKIQWHTWRTLKFLYTICFLIHLNWCHNVLL